jgi:hypothetical protein
MDIFNAYRLQSISFTIMDTICDRYWRNPDRVV